MLNTANRQVYEGYIKIYQYKKSIIISFFIYCLALLVSCNKSYDNDGKHPFFIKAENCYNDGKYEEATSLYQKYLDINPKSSKTNYRLANISQQKKDYIQAVCHYEKYLTLNPNSSDRKIIEKWILASKESLAKQLAEQYPDSSRINTNKKEMGTPIKQKYELQKPQLSISEAVTNNPKENEKQSLPVKYYTVQEGDTLQKISRKLYGSSKYYKLIIEANQNTLKGSTIVRIGNKIIIPSQDTSPKKEN